MNSGTRRGTMFLALFIMFPFSKSAPLAIWAFIILSVSSIKIGMNLNAMDIIMATACTGTPILLNGDSEVSSPSVNWFGVVVSVMRDVPIIKYISRIDINIAFVIPTVDILIIPYWKSILSPAVKSTLKVAVIARSIITALSPFTIYLKGTFDI